MKRKGEKNQNFCSVKKEDPNQVGFVSAQKYS